MNFFRKGLNRIFSLGASIFRQETRTAGPTFPEVDKAFFLSFTRLFSQGQGNSPTEPYKDVAMVYSCIGAIAEDASGVPLLVCSGSRKNKKILEDHDLLKLLEYPNPMMSGSQLIEATHVLLGLHGEVIYILERESDREVPKEIWAFPATRFEPKISKLSGLIEGWTYGHGAVKKELPAHKVLFQRLYNPYDDYRGLSPLSAAKAGIDQDWLAAQYNLAFFRNDARPGGVLETKDSLMEDEYNRVLSQWKDRHRGASKAFEIALLEGGLTYKSTGLNQKDMEWLEGRRFNADEIRMVFKVPKWRLTLDEKFDSNAKARVSRKGYWENCLLPKMAQHEFAFWKDICRNLPGPEVWVEYDRSSIAALQEDLGELADIAKKYWDMGVSFNSLNERLGLGFPEIEGGDVGYLPFNLVPAGSEPPEPKEVAPQASISNPYRLALPSPDTRGVDRRAAWRAYNHLHSTFEKKFQAKIKKFFYEQRKEQLRLLEEKLGGKAVTKAIDIDDLLFDLAKNNVKLKKIVWPLWLSIGDEAGKALFAELGVDPATFVLADTGAMAALQKKLIQIPEINGFTQDLLKATLTEGLANVETVSQLQDRVRETFNFTESRSLTIARTETGQAAGVARDAAMGELGVEEVEWSTAGDDVVRDSHADLDGETVKRGEPFKNGLLYPCDPGGDAAEVINCRCVGVPIVAKE